MQPLFMPVIMFSSFFAPTGTGPARFDAVATLNPFTHVLDGTRSIMLGDLDLAGLAIGLGAFVVLGAATYGLAARAYAGLSTAD